MITVSARDDELVLSGMLPGGSFAYVDGDWLVHGRSGSIPALVADPEAETLRWRDEPPVRWEPAHDADSAAALVFFGLAQRAVSVLPDPAALVEVQGRGLVSVLIRRLLGGSVLANGAGTAVSPPRAVIDATGDPVLIGEAAARLADLGQLVLVGEQLGRRLDLELYPHVHLRGLTVTGVAGPEPGRDVLDPAALPGTVYDDVIRAGLSAASPGVPFHATGLWYRVAF